MNPTEILKLIQMLGQAKQERQPSESCESFIEMIETEKGSNVFEMKR